MLEHLFGSKTRVRLLRLFLHHPDDAFFVRELSRKTHIQMHAVRRELDNLIRFGLLIEVADEEPKAGAGPTGQRRYLRLNKNFILYNELYALLIKSQVLLEENFVKKIRDTGTIKYLALTGRFVNEPDMPTDLLIVGRVNRDRLERLTRDFEREFGADVRFTVLTPQEYQYRRQVGDKFLYQILDGKKIDVVSEEI
jgi:hypothetical protein